MTAMAKEKHSHSFKWKWVIWPVMIFGIISGILYFFLNPKLALDLAVPEFNKLGPVSARVNNDVVYINTSVVLTNKSPYSLEIDTLNCELKLGGKVMVSKSMTEVFNLTKRQTDTIPIRLAVSLTNFREILKGLQGQDSTQL